MIAITQERLHSWQPVDLQPHLADGYKPPEPVIGVREDGHAMLYPGMTHSISGESESGKSWLALYIAAEQIALGNHVVYVDYEAEPGSVAWRLRALGIEPEDIKPCFTYLHPEESIKNHAGHLGELIRKTSPTLVVIDGVTEAMTCEGLNLLDNQDVAEFNLLLPARIARQGPAVLQIDHVVKKRDANNRYALGAGHKLSAITGAAYTVTREEPFAMGSTGRSKIMIAKDRHGGVRRYRCKRHCQLASPQVACPVPRDR